QREEPLDADLLAVEFGFERAPRLKQLRHVAVGRARRAIEEPGALAQQVRGVGFEVRQGERRLARSDAKDDDRLEAAVHGVAPFAGRDVEGGYRRHLGERARLCETPLREALVNRDEFVL